MIKLPESSKDVVDVVTCTETGLTLTYSDAATVKTFTESHNTNFASLFTITSTMENGTMPRVLCRILNHTFPVLLDTGAQLSILPLKMAKHFQPPITIPSNTREVRTYGASNVTLCGPMLLPIRIAGIKISHFFYFVDADAPPLVGYELMRVGRLVIDVANRLVCSRREDWARCDEPVVPLGPNPPVVKEL